MHRTRGDCTGRRDDPCDGGRYAALASAKASRLSRSRIRGSRAKTGATNPFERRTAYWSGWAEEEGLDLHADGNVGSNRYADGARGVLSGGWHSRVPRDGVWARGTSVLPFGNRENVASVRQSRCRSASSWRSVPEAMRD